MTEHLGDAHVQQLLACKAVVVLATVQADGSPLAVAMWFLHDADALTMISVANTQKIRNLRRDPRVSVVAEAGTGSDIVGITVQGRAEFLDESAERRRLVDRLLTKYQPHLERRWGGRTMPRDRVMFRINPMRVTSWGLTRAAPVEVPGPGPEKKKPKTGAGRKKTPTGTGGRKKKPGRK